MNGAPLPKSSRNFFFAAIALHAAFNISAAVLVLSGVVD